jgi:hypothetical protein
MRVSAFASFALLLLIGRLHAQTAQAPSAQTDGNAIEFSLSDRSGQFRYLTPQQFGSVPTDINFGLFLNENRDFVANAAMLFKTNLPLGPVSVAVGPQAYAALLGNPNRDDVIAIAFGGEVRWDVIESYKLAVVGDAFYAPSILSFGKLNNVQDFSARAEVRIVSNLILFAGYRWFTFNLSGEPNEKVQNAVMVGLRWRVY